MPPASVAASEAALLVGPPGCDCRVLVAIVKWVIESKMFMHKNNNDDHDNNNGIYVSVSQDMCYCSYIYIYLYAYNEYVYDFSCI